MTQNSSRDRAVTGNSLTPFVVPVATLALSLTLGASVLFTTGCKSKAPATDNSGTSATSAPGQSATTPAPGPSSTPTTPGQVTQGSSTPAGTGPATGSSGTAGSNATGGSNTTNGSTPAGGSNAVAPPPQTATTTPPPLPGPPPPPPPPPFIDATVPAGKAIPFRITQTLDSKTAKEGDSFSGVVASNVVVKGNVVIPQGTPVSGRVTVAKGAAHFKGSSQLSIELTSMRIRGQNTGIATAAYSKQGKGRGKNTAIKIGAGAGGGALIGGLIGGGKGAAIGALAGGGAGTVAQGVTHGEEVQITSESLIQFALSNPIKVSIPNPALNASAGADATGGGDTTGARKPLPPPSSGPPAQ